MSIEKQRLLSLIEFAQQSARLRSTPVSAVTNHRQVTIYEHHLQGLPGIRLNVEAGDGGNEIWLLIDRLHQTRPPEVASLILRPWLEMTQGPDTEPKLRPATEGANLIDAGTHRSSLKTYLTKQEEALPGIDPRQSVVLGEYNKEAAVKAHFMLYVENAWKPWSEEEKRRRRTIRIYSELFTLKQQLEGGIVEAQLELVWGVGLGIWICNGTTVSYPLMTRPVELALDTETAAIEIRPRDIDPRLEIDWYASVDNPGIGGFEKDAKQFFANATRTFSPFDRSTFEPLLRAAVAHLEPNGVYWANEVPPEDRSLPKATEHLRVTDTWVLFARPRTNSLFLQDLNNLKKAVAVVEKPEELPGAVAAVVTDPSIDNAVIDLPTFRGVSASYNDGRSVSSGAVTKDADLYFPKPFNEEQLRVVQLLEVSDGVVVQGPPGTGKTHTIANVICHYLANGLRVLVTSMKEPALREVQDKLPPDIRFLAISLLTSEQEGMRQFEFAIQKIASEVQGLDRVGTSRAIRQLEESIDALHGKLVRIDRQIGVWARKNLERAQIDGESIDTQDAAREVVQQIGNYEWIPDSLNVTPEFQPQFGDPEVMLLRESRRLLGKDIEYLGCSLPQIAEFPDSKQMLQVHQDLSRFAVLTREVESGHVPPLADSDQGTLEAAQELFSDIDTLRLLRDEVLRFNRSWATSMHDKLRHQDDKDVLLAALDSLGSEIDACVEKRRVFLRRPVAAPEGMDTDRELVEAVSNQVEGKSPFGLVGFFGKSEQKKNLEQVKVVGKAPASRGDWQHVADHLALQNRFRELALRWNNLASELDLDRVAGKGPDQGLAAIRHYDLYRKIKRVVAFERSLSGKAMTVFPSWPGASKVADDAEHLTDLENALRHHLTKNRLAEVWAVKERFQRVLDGRRGRVVDAIRGFLVDTLGNPTVEDAEMQGFWSSLMAELVRIGGLGTHLKIVEDVCNSIEASGAPKYAQQLKQPLEGTIDPLLPDGWRQAWRLRRLATHLNAIDAQDELKNLSKARNEVESGLSRAYQEIVVKRTWLKLAENASPSIRAALQAYLNALQRIGRGTGKRAVRYRQDARIAASHANPAVPCWIMPHYRVSESLPPELGCFDLVIIDEASQSDLTALPALLRAKKVLIVGDDKQVSPEGIGLEEEKIRSLMNRFLGDQVPTYGPQMSPDRSIYDLFKVVFARSGVMLKEHFRCVGPIIEFSKREFYNHELRPLRLPRASERIDPPLVDVVVEDGYRKGALNLAEVRFIVGEIRKIVDDPSMRHRSIGVVSLLGGEQAYATLARLVDELGPELIERHRIECGDARTFQGKERDIMFLTMVSAPNDVGAALVRDTFAQRFNVAASRAQNRMYLVRSVELQHLSPADKLRRSLIAHFTSPYAQDEARVTDLRRLCESPFERELYDELVQRGFWVTPQVKVGQYRIDMVVEGNNDARLALECDGDRYHGPDKWVDDMQRQRVLERAGWVFWRCFASTFVRRRESTLNDLMRTLAEQGIEPTGSERAPRSVHTEQRRIKTES